MMLLRTAAASLAGILLAGILLAGCTVAHAQSDDAVLDHPLQDYGWVITHEAALAQAIEDWAQRVTGRQAGVETIAHLRWRGSVDRSWVEEKLGAPLTMRKLLEEHWPTGDAPPPVTRRTPDPPEGARLPLPDERSVIRAVAAAHPAALANSCIEEGGSWEFMELALVALRELDTRWGYNCKRGDCDDPSIDVVDYFYGIGSEAASQERAEVYIIDIIGAVCPGGNQSPSWTDQTGLGLGRWIYPR